MTILSFLETKPELLQEWNDEQLPENYSKGSHYKATWKCKTCENTWNATIKSRTLLSSGCPECYRRNKSRILRKARGKNNSITKNNPEILQEWDYEKNEKEGFLPEETSRFSSIKVNWKCSKRHSWEATPDNRISNKSGCPYCSGNKVEEKTSLFSINPELLEEWDYSRNTISPKEISSGSTIKIWWKCKNNEEHSWYVSPNSRIKGDTYSKCPYCSGQKVNHTNHLFITHPELKDEWDYQKNKVDPHKIRYGSKIKVFWRCSKGHSWFAQIRDRSIKSSGCPECRNSITKGHQQVIDLIKDKFSGEIKINDRKQIRNPETNYPLELDIFLPEKKIAIEFNGDYYHSSEFNKDFEKRHQIKTQLCESKGIKLIHIGEKEWFSKPEIFEDILMKYLK
jgi:protein-arginine kinase activator protein McsA